MSGVNNSSVKEVRARRVSGVNQSSVKEVREQRVSGVNHSSVKEVRERRVWCQQQQREGGERAACLVSTTAA